MPRVRSHNLDLSRGRRQGFPEVVYGEGKSWAQLLRICREYRRRGLPLLVTRLLPKDFPALRKIFQSGRVVERPEGRCFSWIPPGHRRNPPGGVVNLISAGSSDERVLMEAWAVLEFFGVKTSLICDCGVAGIHRILRRKAGLRRGRVNIVAAGMDGALPSVVGGLVASPVIALPTSVGYGSSFKGISALLAMLNSCANGVVVVNIDNGFGAAMAALRVLSGARPSGPLNRRKGTG